MAGTEYLKGRNGNHTWFSEIFYTDIYILITNLSHREIITYVYKKQCEDGQKRDGLSQWEEEHVSGDICFWWEYVDSVHSTMVGLWQWHLFSLRPTKQFFDTMNLHDSMTAIWPLWLCLNQREIISPLYHDKTMKIKIIYHYIYRQSLIYLCRYDFFSFYSFILCRFIQLFFCMDLVVILTHTHTHSHTVIEVEQYQT